MRTFGIMVKVFAYSLGDRASILARVMPKTRKMVLDTFLTISILRHGSWVNGPIHGKESLPSLRYGVVAIEKGAIWPPSMTIGQLTYVNLFCCKK